MIPNFTILNREISIYMLFAVISILTAMWFGTQKAKKMKLDDFRFLVMFLFSLIGVLVGGHLLYGITQADQIRILYENRDKISSIPQFFQCLQVVFGGSVYYGGFLGSILAAYIYCKKTKLPLGEYMDLSAMTVPLFHSIARLGCFFSGCCYGIPWEHGVTYKYSMIEQANGVPRFPVQLLEAFLNFLLFLLILYFCKKGYFRHNLMAVYCTVYPTYRFLLEYLRDDEYRGFIFNLSTSQFISVLIFVCTIIIVIVNKKKKAPAAAKA